VQVFENGVFISCSDNDEVFRYLVEDKGKIIFIGNELPDRFQEVTHRVNLGGQSVLPAFVDTHIHFASFGLFNFGLNVRYANDFADMGRQINKYASQHNQDKFLFGFGVTAHTVVERRLPTRVDLDKMTDRTLLIEKYDGHAAVANSALIQRLPLSVQSADGFDKETGWFKLDPYFPG